MNVPPSAKHARPEPPRGLDFLHCAPSDTLLIIPVSFCVLIVCRDPPFPLPRRYYTLGTRVSVHSESIELTTDSSLIGRSFIEVPESVFLAVVTLPGRREPSLRSAFSTSYHAAPSDFKGYPGVRGHTENAPEVPTLNPLVES